jgi:hypothetical protein
MFFYAKIEFSFENEIKIFIYVIKNRQNICPKCIRKKKYLSLSYRIVASQVECISPFNVQQRKSDKKIGKTSIKTLIHVYIIRMY